MNNSIAKNKSSSGISVLHLFFLMFIFKPLIIDDIPILDSLFNGMRFAIFGMCCFFYIINRIPLSKPIIFLIAWRIWLVFSAFLNNSELNATLFRSFMCLSAVMSIDLLIKNNPGKLLNTLTFLFTFLLILTVLFNVFAISGVPILILGIRNNIPGVAMPAICLGFLRSLYLRNRFLSPGTIFISALSIFLIFYFYVSTSIIGLFFLFVLLVIPLHHKPFNIKMKHILLGGLISNIAIIYFRIQDTIQQIFALVIVDLLDKHMTFTGRTYIWDVAIEEIKNSPIIGHGETGDAFVGYVPELFQEMAGHSTLIQLIFDGGLVAFILFSGWLYYSLKKADELPSSKHISLIQAFIFSTLITAIAGSDYHFPFFYAVPTLVANSELLLDKPKEVTS